MGYGRGEVWWGPAPHKSGPAYRPWVVVSGPSHPFSETECIGLAMTTQEHAGAVEVPDGAWVRGGSDADSYVSPWYVATMKYRDLDRQQGTLDHDVVDEAVRELHGYTPETDSG